MRLNLFSQLFSALVAGVTWWNRLASPHPVSGSWIRASVIPPLRRGKTGIVAAKRRARKSRNRQRHLHGRA